MLIPSPTIARIYANTSLSRRVNANSQLSAAVRSVISKLIKKGEC